MTAVAMRTIPARGGSLTGTGELVRLGLRRDRIPLIAWIAGVSVVTLSTFSTIATLYPDEASREAIVAGINANPAFVVITGPPFSATVGGLTAWRIGVIGALMVSLMAVFTVIRRTRADEEAGRTELIASAVVGRAAPLAAGLTLAMGASLAVGVIVGAGSIGLGHPAASSLLLGAALAGPGLVFSGIAAIAAQLSEITRTASAWAGGFLGICYALRGIGDATPSLSFLTWVSPLGWTEKVEAFGADRAVVLLLFLAAAAGTVAVAVSLQGRRDIGLGILATRLGVASNPRLGSPLALAWRLQRGSLCGWAVAFLAYGAVTGSIATTGGDLLQGNAKMIEIMQEMGGAGAVANTLLAVMAGLAGLLGGVVVISAAVRMAGEESAGRAGAVLATTVGRGRWLAGQLIMSLGGVIVALLLGGLVAGVAYGAKTTDVSFGVGFGRALAAFVVQIPAVAVMAGVALAIFALVPRFTSVSWGALTLALLLGQLGALLQLPRAVMGISPYAHTPLVPSQPVDWGSVAGLVAVAVALLALSFLAFRRRDLVAG